MNRLDVELSLSAKEPDLKVNDSLDLSFEDETVLCTCRRTRKVVGRLANDQLQALQQSPTEASIRTLKKAAGITTHAVVRVACRPQPAPSAGKPVLMAVRLLQVKVSKFGRRISHGHLMHAVLPVRIPEADEEALRASSQLHTSHLQHLGESSLHISCTARGARSAVLNSWHLQVPVPRCKAS